MKNICFFCLVLCNLLYKLEVDSVEDILLNLNYLFQTHLKPILFTYLYKSLKKYLSSIHDRVDSSDVAIVKSDYPSQY